MERLVLVDDRDGTIAEGVQRHPLTLGEEVIDSVDLTEANRELFREELRVAVKRFIAQSRPPRTEQEAAENRVTTKLTAVAKSAKTVKVGGKSHLSKKQRAEREQLNAIRVWARKAGYEISPYGKIPAAVMEAFQSPATGPGSRLKSVAVTKAADDDRLFSNATA